VSGVMSMISPRLRRGASLLIFVSCGPLQGSDRLDGLVNRSPFQPDKPTGGAVAAPTTSQVEFGGYLVEGGRPVVSLTDLANGRSFWVGLKDTTAPYFIETLDRNLPAVTLRMGDRLLTLPLRKPSADAGSGNVIASIPTPAAMATVLDPGSSNNRQEAGKTVSEDGVAPPTNRIPRQTLRIPKRVDDPN
jgi:hypothetical protein